MAKRIMRTCVTRKELNSRSCTEACRSDGASESERSGHDRPPRLMDKGDRREGRKAMRPTWKVGERTRLQCWDAFGGTYVVISREEYQTTLDRQNQSP